MAIVKDKVTGRFVKNLEQRQCFGCEQWFQPRMSDSKTCSRKCMGLYFKRLFNKKIGKVCEECGELFEVHLFRAEEAKFCNKSCYGESLTRKIGKQHPSWKGGITPQNMLIRSSRKYKNWRKSVFERDNYTCQFCGIRGIEIHADHIKPFAYFPELRLELSNGRTLCVPCHKKTDTYLKNFSKRAILEMIT